MQAACHDRACISPCHDSEIGSSMGPSASSSFQHAKLQRPVAVDKVQPRWPLTLLLTALVAQWFVFSYLFNVNLKSWFHQHPGPGTLLPLLLSIFAGNAGASGLWILWLGGFVREGALTRGSLRLLLCSYPLDFALLCGSGLAGGAAVVVVLQQGSIELVQIARSLGPAFAALWAYLALDQRTTGSPLCCLLLTLGGTALASWREPTFSTSVAATVLLVNATLAYRNTVCKRLLLALPSQDAGTCASVLLCLVNTLGAVLVGGIWVAAFLMGHPVAAPAGWLVHRHLLVLAFCNFAYNLASQLVLANVQVVSHGMLELSKRVFVVLAACCFGSHSYRWQPHNAMGAIIAVIGTLGYFWLAHSTVSSVRRVVRPAGSSGGGPRHVSSSGGGWRAKRSSGSGHGPRQRPIGSLGGAEGAGNHPCVCQPSQDGGLGVKDRCTSTGDFSQMAEAVQVFERKADVLAEAFRGGASLGGSDGGVRRRWSSGDGSNATAAPHGQQQVNDFGRAGLQPQALQAHPLAPLLEVSRGGIIISRHAHGAAGGQPLPLPCRQVVRPAPAVEAYERPITPPKAQLAQLLMLVLLLLSPFVIHTATKQHPDTSPGRGTPPDTHQVPSIEGHQQEPQGRWGMGTGIGAHIRRELPPYVDNEPTVFLRAAARVSGAALDRSMCAVDAAAVASGTLPHRLPLQLPGDTASLGQGAQEAAAGTVLSQRRALRSAVQQGATGGLTLAVPRSDGLLQVVAASSETLAAASVVAAAVPTMVVGDASGAVRATAAAEFGGQPGSGAAEEATLASPTDRNTIRGLYVGWLGHANLGDEIVSDIFLDLFTEAILGVTGADVKVTVDRDINNTVFQTVPHCSYYNNTGCDFAVLGGGSTVYVDYLRRLSGVMSAKRPLVIFGSGYQTGLRRKAISERYFNMFRGASLLGGVRGPSTHRYLRAQQQVTALPILYDSGLLAGALYGLSPVRSTPILQKLETIQRPVAVMTFKGNLSDVVRSTVLELSATYQIVLQPVDPDSLDAHNKEAAALNLVLPAGALPVLVHEDYTNWAAVLHMYDRANISLSARLHSGVLSTSMKRPTLFLSGNNKMLDYLESMNLSRWVLDNRRVEKGQIQLMAAVADAVTPHNSQAITEALGVHRDLALQQYRALISELLLRLAADDPAKYKRIVQCCQHIHISRSAQVSYRAPITVSCLHPHT